MRRLAGITVAGTAVELAIERHWATALRLIPWVAVVVAAIGVAVVTSRPHVARGIAIAVGTTGAFGVLEHVIANHEAGPLDYRYATRWSSMSGLSQWWAATNGSVGPSPILAPLILTLAALMLWLGTGGTVRGHG